jgi:hypothetical protein
MRIPLTFRPATRFRCAIEHVAVWERHGMGEPNGDGPDIEYERWQQALVRKRSMPSILRILASAEFCVVPLLPAQTPTRNWRSKTLRIVASDVSLQNPIQLPIYLGR